MSTFQSRRKLKNENCVRPLKGGNRGVCQEKQFRPSAAVWLLSTRTYLFWATNHQFLIPVETFEYCE